MMAPTAARIRSLPRLCRAFRRTRHMAACELLQYVARLPSYVATRREAEGPVNRADLAEVEARLRPKSQD